MAIAAEAGPSVVGGSPASVAEFPWQVSLQFPGAGHGCGGSVVAPTKVLTAAHCLAEDVAGLQVRIGSDRHDGGGELIPVAAVALHPGWNPKAVVNDAAMLTLTRPTAAAPIRTAGPAEAGVVSGGSPATVTGWGLISERPERLPDTLRRGDLALRSDEECERAYEGDWRPEVVICAGGGRPDACRGDSGGPLQTPFEGGWIQVGIVSYGQGVCGDSPGAYTRVTAVAPWIAAELGAPPAPLPPPPPPPPAKSNLRAGIGAVTCGRYTCRINVSTRGSTVGLAAMMVKVRRLCTSAERRRGICRRPSTRLGFATRRSASRWRIDMPLLPLGEVRITAVPLAANGKRFGKAGVAEGVVELG